MYLRIIIFFVENPKKNCLLSPINNTFDRSKLNSLNELYKSINIFRLDGKYKHIFSITAKW